MRGDTEARELAPSALMRAMGARDGFFDPMPPDQHAWQMHTKDPLVRVWSWLCSKTVRKGHRSPYAVDANGNALTLEHAAADLGMDISNARRAWQEGVQRGLWRNGQGHAKRWMYLCGKVRPAEDSVQDEGEEKENSGSLYKLLPSYIQLQIKKLPKQAQERLLDRLGCLKEREKQVVADLTAAVRNIFDHIEDTTFQDFGIKKIREEHPTRRSKDRHERVQFALPLVEKFVETLDPEVRTNSSYKAPANVVQTSASLFPLEDLEKGETTPTSSSSSPPEAAPSPPETTTTKTPQPSQSRGAVANELSGFATASTPDDFRLRLTEICARHVRYQPNSRQMDQIRRTAGRHSKAWLEHLEQPRSMRDPRPWICGIENPGGLRADAATFAAHAEVKTREQVKLAQEAERSRAEFEARQAAEEARLAASIERRPPEEREDWEIEFLRGYRNNKTKRAAGGAPA